MCRSTARPCTSISGPRATTWMGSARTFAGTDSFRPWGFAFASAPQRRHPSQPKISAAPLGCGLGQHIPFVAQRPSERRQLSVDHAPFELVPRPEILQAVSVLDLSRGAQRSLPGLPSYGSADGRLLFHDLELPARDLLPPKPLVVVPNLLEQLVLRSDDLRDLSARLIR